MMRWCRLAALALVVCLVSELRLLAQNPPAAAYNGICEQGNVAVAIPGTPGSGNQRFQQSYPRCTVDVYLTGTTNRAMLYSNANRTGAPLANPMTADQSGRFRFFINPGTYDIRLSGGGIPQPWTIASVNIGNVQGPAGPAGPQGPTGPQGPPGPGGGGGGGMNCGLTALDPANIPVCAEMMGGVAYPQWWGAKADGKILGGSMGGTGCSGSAGSPSLSCPQANFTAGDAGKAFDVAHGGTPNCGNRVYGRNDLKMNCNLVGTIQSVQNTTTVTLSASLLSNVANDQFAYASSDDAAVQAALDSGIRTILFMGIYGVTGPRGSATMGNGTLGGVFINRALTAPGPGVGRLLRIGPVAWDGIADGVFYVENGSTHLTMSGISIWGTNANGELSTFGPSHDGLMICTGMPNANICNGLPGNGNGSIDDTRFINCDFSHHWGLGFHVPGTGSVGGPGVYNTLIAHSSARWNSYDGFNPNTTDGLVVDTVDGSYNGTGGLEISAFGSLTVTGSTFNRNHSIGLSLGGLTDESSINRTCRISGNDLSDNGNGYTANLNASGSTTIGYGLIVGHGTQNCSIIANTIRHNHLMGLESTMVAKDRHIQIANNLISTNGIKGVTQLSIGIYGNFYGSVVSNNTIVNEAYNDIVAIGRTNNVVTVQTAQANNYEEGFDVHLFSTPDAAFDGDFMLTTYIDARTFSYPQTGPDLPVRHYEAGRAGLGQVFSSTGGFNQNEGMVIQNCNNTDVLNNTVRYHDFSNVTFIQFLPEDPYINCQFTSDTNTMGQLSTLNSSVRRDLYLENDITGQGAQPLLPAVGGFVASIPSVQSVGQACTTAATAGATCTVTVAHNFGGDLGYMITSMTTYTTSCRLEDAPMPQTGTPVILRAVQTAPNQATVTIGSFGGQASGGGTLICLTNFRY